MIVNEGGGGKRLPQLTSPGGAGDALSGKQFIDQNGEIVTGTIASKDSNDVSVSGRTVTIPAGHYPNQVSKSIASATQATPSISVNNNGLITASATQSAGYVSSGTKSKTYQLTTQAGKTVTPGTSQQTAVSSGRYTTGTVYVAGDSDLIASNIRKGVNIFGVAGTYEGQDPIEMVFSQGTSVPITATSKVINGLSSGDTVLFAIKTSAVLSDSQEEYLIRFKMDSNDGTKKNVIVGCSKDLSGEVGFLAIKQNASATSLTLVGTSSYGDSYAFGSVRIDAISYMVL